MGGGGEGGDVSCEPPSRASSQVRTRTNRSGDVQGGLSNGEDIIIRVAFKPTSTIGVKQRTVRRRASCRLGDFSAASRRDRDPLARWSRGACDEHHRGVAFLLISCCCAQVTREGVETDLRARGRHDACVVPRAVPMVESMVALVLADQLLQHYAQCELLPRESAVGVDSKVARQFARSA